MAEGGRLQELLTDSRLSSDARVLGMYIASKGDGWHEVGFGEFQDVLSADCGADRVRSALDQLDRKSWIQRKTGGRGHFDSFTFNMPSPGILSADNMPSPGILKATVVRSKEDVRIEPPVVPLLRFQFSNQADRVFQTNAERLAGCRGAFQDYLQARVCTDRQYAYAQTVASWAQGGGGSPFKGIPPPEIPGILANAFNELLADGEEGLKYKAGDTKNLRTKLGILIRQRNQANERITNGNGNHGRGPARESGAGAAASGDQSSRRRRGFGADG